MRKELVYQEFLLHYLQEEQNKRREELNEIEKKLEILKNNPNFKKLLKLAAKKN